MIRNLIMVTKHLIRVYRCRITIIQQNAFATSLQLLTGFTELKNVRNYKMARQKFAQLDLKYCTMFQFKIHYFSSNQFTVRRFICKTVVFTNFLSCVENTEICFFLKKKKKRKNSWKQHAYLLKNWFHGIFFHFSILQRFLKKLVSRKFAICAKKLFATKKIFFRLVAKD